MAFLRQPKTNSSLSWEEQKEIKNRHTQFRQQLVDGLDDVGLECSKVLLEVLLAESSRGQQFVERLLLVGFLAAASRSAGWSATRRACRHFSTDVETSPMCGFWSKSGK